MRLKIKLEYKELKLPIHYNHILQAVILKYIDSPEYANFIHNKGYEFKKRKYKLYTFSRIFGEFELKKDYVKYLNEGEFIISSADNQMLNYLMNQMFKKPGIEILDQKVKIKKIDYSALIPSNNIKVITKSAITVYSTFEKDGRKKTYYYSPKEKEFNELIKNNLIKKYKAFYKKEINNPEFEIKSLGNLKEIISRYKNIIIKGWMGIFALKGTPELLTMAYDSGVGAKNSIGFGCVEQI